MKGLLIQSFVKEAMQTISRIGTDPAQLILKKIWKCKQYFLLAIP